MARTLEDLEAEILQLPQEKMTQFRAWYEKVDSDLWDKQIEDDVTTGKLDALAESALADHKAGKSKRL